MSETISNTATVGTTSPEPTPGHPVFQTVDGEVYRVVMEPYSTVASGGMVSSSATVASAGTVASGGTLTHPGTIGAHAVEVPTFVHPPVHETVIPTGAVAASGTIASAGTVASTAEVAAVGPVTAGETIASAATVAAAGTVASSGTVSNAGTMTLPTTGTVYYVVADPTTGHVTQTGSVPAAQARITLSAMKATPVTSAQYMVAKAGIGRIALVNGEMQPITTAASMAGARASAMAQINQGTQRCWAALLTGGVGQLYEHLSTVAEANAVTAASDPLSATSYPWLQADVAAQSVAATLVASGTVAATGTVASAGPVAAATPYTLRTAAAAALARDAAWQTYGVAVKTVRLAAVVAVQNASTAAAIQTALNATQWPTPPAAGT